MYVATLITAEHPDTYQNCTLSLDTLRVGFPTADIEVFFQPGCVNADDIYARCKKIGVEAVELPERVHHADWIKNTIVLGSLGKEPTVIVDPDCIFWSNCEGFQFSGLVAGMYVPTHWNHWSQSTYAARIHTSFMWFPDPGAFLQAVFDLTPKLSAEYLPCDLYRPVMAFQNGDPIFYDTMALFCQASVGKKPVDLFQMHHLDCYDHINCSSFYHQMLERFDDPRQKAGFAQVHELARTEPQKLRGLWKQTVAYYLAQEAELYRRLYPKDAQISTTQGSGSHSGHI